MITSEIEVHNSKKKETENLNNNPAEKSEVNNLNPSDQPSTCPCSIKQLLIIIIPITTVLLFAAIFIPVYLESKDDDDKKEEFDSYQENIVNITYATLTPKDGYDHILVFLGGISDESDKYFEFFKSKSTFVPKGTKIYFLSGQPRQMAFMDYYYPDYAGYSFPGWFNVDPEGNLVPSGTEDDFAQAKESLKIILDEIDRIHQDEKIDYKKIYLSGFSQGGIMTNYVILNSRHELGGYIVFSGYVFDDILPANSIVMEGDLTSAQSAKLNRAKNYHILATHSFNDDAVFYPNSALGYQNYYKYYTDFILHSFGNLKHVFPEQPIHQIVRKWLKESMGK